MFKSEQDATYIIKKTGEKVLVLQSDRKSG